MGVCGKRLFDIDGTLNVGSGTYDATGTFDATSGSVTFTDAED